MLCAANDCVNATRSCCVVKCCCGFRCQSPDAQWLFVAVAVVFLFCLCSIVMLRCFARAFVPVSIWMCLRVVGHVAVVVDYKSSELCRVWSSVAVVALSAGRGGWFHVLYICLVISLSIYLHRYKFFGRCSVVCCII